MRISQLLWETSTTAVMDKIPAGRPTPAPSTVKATPTRIRVDPAELESVYLTDPICFSMVNKTVQTIMSAKRTLVGTEDAVSKFQKFIDNIGYCGGDVTWNELLYKIFQNQCIYGHSFVEIVLDKASKIILDWEMVDSKSMDYAKNSSSIIAKNEYGAPLGYVQTIPYGEEHPTQKHEIPDDVTMTAYGVFIPRKKIAHFKLYTVGDGFYPVGLIEPVYRSSLTKLNVEEALGNSIWRHGFPTMIAKLGDLNHEPSPTEIQNILTKLKDSSFKQEMAVPYYYNIEIIEPKKAEKLKEHLEYFKEQEIAGGGVPKPYVTGSGEDSNKHALDNQSALFQLTLYDIITKTCSAIQKYLFEPLAKQLRVTEVPSLKWDNVGVQEVQNKSQRIIDYTNAGILTPEQAWVYVKELENLE